MLYNITHGQTPTVLQHVVQHVYVFVRVVEFDTYHADASNVGAAGKPQMVHCSVLNIFYRVTMLLSADYMTILCTKIC